MDRSKSARIVGGDANLQCAWLGVRPAAEAVTVCGLAGERLLGGYRRGDQRIRERFPKPPGAPRAVPAYMKRVDEAYVTDAKKGMLMRAEGVEPTRAVKPCGFSCRLRLSPP
jgi:hypothetical protein